MNKEQRREYNKKWKAANPEKIKAYRATQKAKGNCNYNAKYYAANKEAFRDRQYKSNEKNKEKHDAYMKAYYAKNKAKINAASKAYYMKKKIEELEQKIIDYPSLTNQIQAEIKRIRKE